MDTDVTGHFSAIKYEFKWVIDDFCTSCNNRGHPLKSPVFTITSNIRNSNPITEWQLELDLKCTKNFISIILYALKGEEIKATASFELLNKDGAVVEYRTTGEQVYRTGIYPKSHGCMCFVQHDYIKENANEILDGNKLTIVCTITMCEHENKQLKQIESPINLENNSDPHQQLLASDFEQLLDDKDYSDVELIVQGKTLKAHRSILGKRSPVFDAMFRSEMKEKRENKVEITDLKHEVLLEMLRYIYSGKVNNIDPIADELLVAADKYSIDSLKQMCGNSLSENLKPEKAVEILLLADRHCVHSLYAKAIKFVVSHAAKIVNTPEFQQLPNNIMFEVCSAMANKIN